MTPDELPTSDEPTVEQVENARNVLLWLSQNSDDGGLRDAIGRVRLELADVLDWLGPR